jgi:hypothetical protein
MKTAVLEHVSLWRSVGSLACYAPLNGMRKIEARLQAACWYVVVIVKSKGDEQVLAEDSSWARVVSSEEDSDLFVQSIPEEMHGRLGLFEKAVDEVAERNNQGLVLEFGGGEFSTVAIVRLLERIGRSSRPLVFTFDWWRGLPRRWREGFEKGHFSNNGTAPNNLEKLAQEGKVALVGGLVEDTIGKFMEGRANNTVLDLVVIDMWLGGSARTVLNRVVRWMQPGTLMLFGSYLNFEGWKRGGEYEAWISQADNAGITFEYVAFYSTWVLVRIVSMAKAKDSTKSVARVDFSKGTWISVVFALICVCFGGLLLRERMQPSSLKTRTVSTGKKARKLEGDLKTMKVLDSFKEFRTCCTDLELKMHAANSEGDVTRRDALQVQCADLLSSLISEGLKLQVAVIARLDDRFANQRTLLAVQEELGTILVTLNRQKTELSLAIEQEKLVPSLNLNSVNDAQLCVVCLENEKCMLLLPCAHVCLCELCLPTVHCCPICRQRIAKTQKVFL